MHLTSGLSCLEKQQSENLLVLLEIKQENSNLFIESDIHIGCNYDGEKWEKYLAKPPLNGLGEGIDREADKVNLHAKWKGISCMDTDNTIKQISYEYCFQGMVLSYFELCFSILFYPFL